MIPADGLVLVFTTVDHEDKADSFARGLIEARLAACVMRLPAGKSMYRFESDEITVESEHMLVIKTHRDKLNELEAHFQQHHPYSVPEMITLSAETVAESYCSWMLDELRMQ